MFSYSLTKYYLHFLRIPNNYNLQLIFQWYYYYVWFYFFFNSQKWKKNIASWLISYFDVRCAIKITGYRRQVERCKLRSIIILLWVHCLWPRKLFGFHANSLSPRYSNCNPKNIEPTTGQRTIIQDVKEKLCMRWACVGMTFERRY